MSNLVKEGHYYFTLHFSASKKILKLIVKSNKKTQKVIELSAQKVKAAANDIPIDSDEEKENLDNVIQEATEKYGQNDEPEEDEEDDDDLDEFLTGLGLPTLDVI